jgi:hypothetical protein
LSELPATDAYAPDDASDADCPDDVAGPDSSGEADESEPQAASRTRAKSAPTISRTPIPFFMMIASSVLWSVSDASLKTSESPNNHKNAYASAQADLQPEHDLLPREAIALLLGSRLDLRRASLSFLFDLGPLRRRLFGGFLL